MYDVFSLDKSPSNCLTIYLRFLCPFDTKLSTHCATDLRHQPNPKRSLLDGFRKPNTQAPSPLL